MTALHKIPPAPPEKSTTHSRTQAGQRYGGMKHAYDDIPRFSYVLEARNEEPKPDWKEGKLAALIVTLAACSLVWALLDCVWTKAMTEPSILVD